MYAVIETGGKQYRVQVGDELFIEKIEGYSGEKVQFDQVLAVSDDAGFKVGTPLVDGAVVEAEQAPGWPARRWWSTAAQRTAATSPRGRRVGQRAAPPSGPARA